MLCVSSKKNNIHTEDVAPMTEGPHIDSSGNSGIYHIRRHSIQEDHRGRAFVELPKLEGCGLGLVISGGADKDCAPRVSYLRPGGIAQRSDSLEVGDYIVSVNGIKTGCLRHEEIVSLIKNAEESVILEVEYELPEPPQTTFSVICKRIEVQLKRDSENLGFTLRGGLHEDATKCRPLTITQIRPGSAADREGTLKVGDRILAIDGIKVTQSSLAEALAILKHSEIRTRLLVEYDVSVIDAVQNSQGPLLVEIDKTPGCSLGVELAATKFRGQTVLCINSISAASIADRCGALHEGDHILAIDDTSLEHMTVAEASQLLKSSMGEVIRLEILPAVQLKEEIPDKHNYDHGGGDRDLEDLPTPSASMASLNSMQSFTTFNSMTTEVGSAIIPLSHTGSTTTMDSRGGTSWGSRYNKHASQSSLTSASTYTSAVLPHHQVCRTEVIEVTLIADQRGFGLILENGGCDRDVLTAPPVITFIEPDSAADRCGVIQEGDRILAINDIALDNRTLEEANNILKESGVKALLQVEFDIAESIVPSSGIYVVKLHKRGAGLGITINSPNNRKPDEPLLITDVRKGSVAHRTGTIHPGDRLLAIDCVRMDNCSLEDAAQVLQNSQDIVKLTIRKDETFAEEPDPSTTITYTVELPKFGGPLGITISGTEEPFDPIYISSLAEGGLAEKTGALHVGDRILAINGQSLQGRPLPDAIQLLQNARDTVMLKITRPAHHSNGRGIAGKSVDSVDSALESWGSSGLDLTSNRVGNTQEGSGSSGVHTQSSDCNLPVGGSTYCDLNNELHLVDENHLDALSAASTMSDTDEWSRKLDELDHFSQAEVVQDFDNESEHSLNTTKLAQSFADQVNNSSSASAKVSLPSSIVNHREHSNRQIKPSASHKQLPPLASDQHSIHSNSSSGSRHSAGSAQGGVVRADQHLREVEEQLQNIFSPTPVELVKVCLCRQRESESYGFSLSDGVYEKGVFISAVQPGSPADVHGQLKPFDRLLQVNHVRTKDFDCHQVVPMIARSGLKVHLVFSRNPLATPTSTPTSSPHSTLQWNRGEQDTGSRAGTSRTEHDAGQSQGSEHRAPLRPPQAPTVQQTEPHDNGQLRINRTQSHDTYESSPVWQPQYGLPS